ncbi:MAG: hypothetical protein A2Z45_00200 [Chloroflexi bacterium RBG_19FT_COMBO_55_16]|nr:MAG: hypothetical protein A2Z45_00200 [Chloroflexi bacterium RBG_19FT_COMBO_55_16]
MTAILTHLQSNWQRLNLERYGDPSRLSYFLLTPRFRASSHVLFLVSSNDRSTPTLVVKVPRLAGESPSLQKETATLRAIQSTRPQGFASIPRVVAFEPVLGRQILVETALVGKAMNPTTVRHDPDSCCRVVMDWLIDLQAATRHSAQDESDWFSRLIEQPFRAFTALFPYSADEARLLERTWDLVSPLREVDMPLMIEHGDLSSPNIMLLERGGPGVVDWELADPRGLPACDLFFFMTYVAFARENARSNSQHLSAFKKAFFGHAAWASSSIRMYAQELDLAPVWLTPLFVLCWLRYMTGLLIRLDNAKPSSERIDTETAAWLRRNRYYSLWRYAVSHVDDINF